MISNPRRRIAALTLTLMLPLAAFGASAGAQSPIVHFTHESYPAFQAQLAAGKIKGVVFNKKPHTVHVTLKSGQHVLAVYPPTNEPAIAAQLTSKGVAYKIEHVHKASAPVHHKLRYIAAAVLVVLIVVVIVVLAINRRRNAMEGPVDGAQAEPASGPPPA